MKGDKDVNYTVMVNSEKMKGHGTDLATLYFP